MAKKIKHFIIAVLSVFVLCSPVLFTEALTIQKTKHGSISTSVGSGTVNCTATHYTIGNTRWSAAATASANVLYVSTTASIIQNETTEYHTKIKATVDMTTAAYQHDSNYKYFTFNYNASNNTVY